MQALRALRSAQGTLEGLPAELLGRVNQSGRWSFKQMLEAASPERSPDAHLRGGGAAANGRPRSASLQQAAALPPPLSAAQKAAMSAVSMVAGSGIAAHRVSPR